MPDQKLREYATERQWELLCALEEHGSQRKAADALGVAKNLIYQAVQAVKKRAASHGYAPDHDMVHPLPPGFKAQGVSTLYDMQTGEARVQWVKSQVDKEQQEAIFREAIDGLVATMPKCRSTAGPKSGNENLMTVIPVSDHHLGMYSWKPETDGNYNLDIAEEVLMAAINHLVSVGPDSEHAMVITLGDFLHYDSYAALTASGHLLDADSRFPRMVRVAMRLLRYLVTAALRRHQKVTLVIQQGNHDPSSTIFLREALSHIYDNEDRLTVDTEPKPFSCHQFGKNMIGSHHGDKVKLGALPLLFATDYPEIWGSTEHRTIHTGHVHHDQVLLKEHSGAVCESHRILAPKDSFAATNGWRAQQSMKSIILHTEFGEVERHTFSPQMINE